MDEDEKRDLHNQGYTYIGDIGETQLVVHSEFWDGCGSVVPRDKIQDHSDWHDKVITR